MLSSSGAIAGSLVLLTMAPGVRAASPDDYTNNALLAIKTLNDEWYNAATGLWDDGWWNSANVLTTLADFTSLRLTEANALNLGGYMLNTFEQAQRAEVSTIKTFDTEGIPVTSNCIDDLSGCMAKREFRERDMRNAKMGMARRLSVSNKGRLSNDFYDDSAWWALAVMRAYDVTGDDRYLDSAVAIWEDLLEGLGGPCGGGIFWNTEREYVNAITNELYLFVAASLANRIPRERRFLKAAQDQWTWFRNSGLINDDNLINDGLDGDCRNNGFQTWSYNQGVILGALVELSRANGGDDDLLDEAHTIASAAIEHLAGGQDGVVIETDACELLSGNCGRDGQQFKGIFIRNLRYLHEASPRDAYRELITKNADVIWANDRNAQNMLGVAWNGPFVTATGMSQSAALDVLVAAIAVA